MKKGQQPTKLAQRYLAAINTSTTSIIINNSINNSISTCHGDDENDDDDGIGTRAKSDAIDKTDMNINMKSDTNMNMKQRQKNHHQNQTKMVAEADKQWNQMPIANGPDGQQKKQIKQNYKSKCASIMPIPNCDHTHVDLDQSRNGSTSPSRIRPLIPLDKREAIPPIGDIECLEKVSSGGIHRSTAGTGTGTGTNGIANSKRKKNKWQTQTQERTSSYPYPYSNNGAINRTASASPALTNVSDSMTDVVDNRNARIRIGSSKNIDVVQSVLKDVIQSLPLDRRPISNIDDDGKSNSDRNNRYSDRNNMYSDRNSDRNSDKHSDGYGISNNNNRNSNNINAATSTPPVHLDIPLKPWQKRKGKKSDDQGWIKKTSNQGSRPMSRSPIRKPLAPAPPLILDGVPDQAENDTMEDNISSPQHKFNIVANHVAGSLGQVRHEKHLDVKVFEKGGLRPVFGRLAKSIPTKDISKEYGKGGVGVDADDVTRDIASAPQVVSLEHGRSSLDGEPDTDFISVKSRLRSWSRKGKDIQSFRSSPSSSPKSGRSIQLQPSFSPSLRNSWNSHGVDTVADTVLNSPKRGKIAIHAINDDNAFSVGHEPDQVPREEVSNVVDIKREKEVTSQRSMKDRIRAFGHTQPFQTLPHSDAGVKKASWTRDYVAREKKHGNQQTKIEPKEEGIDIEMDDKIPSPRKDTTAQMSIMPIRSWRGCSNLSAAKQGKTKFTPDNAGAGPVDTQSNPHGNDIVRNSTLVAQPKNIEIDSEENIRIVRTHHQQDHTDGEDRKKKSNRGVKGIRSRFEALNSKKPIEVISRKAMRFSKVAVKREDASHLFPMREQHTHTQKKTLKTHNSGEVADYTTTSNYGISQQAVDTRKSTTDAVNIMTQSQPADGTKATKNDNTDSMKQTQLIRRTDSFVTSGKNLYAQIILPQKALGESPTLVLTNRQGAPNKDTLPSTQKVASSMGGFQSLRSRFEAMSGGQRLTTNIEDSSTRCVEASDSTLHLSDNTDSNRREISNNTTLNKQPPGRPSEECDLRLSKNHRRLDISHNANRIEKIPTQSPASSRPDNSPVQFVDSPGYYTASNVQSHYFQDQNKDEINHQNFSEKSRMSAFTKYNSVTKGSKSKFSAIADSDKKRSDHSSTPNDIPWKNSEPNDIPWTDRELLEEREQSFVTQKVDVNFSYGAEYLDYSFEEDDCDGVTLCPTASDVSCLSIPSCIQSITASSVASDSCQTSDEDTGAMESLSEKQSTTLGLSEASSSQTSEAATPLIHSTLGAMNMRFGIRSSSDTTGTTSYNGTQFNALLGSLPPPIDLKECDENSDEVLFKHPSTEYATTSKHFEEHLGIQNQQKWKNDFFAVDSVKSLPTADSIAQSSVTFLSFVTIMIHSSWCRSASYAHQQ